MEKSRKLVKRIRHKVDRQFPLAACDTTGPIILPNVHDNAGMIQRTKPYLVEHGYRSVKFFVPDSYILSAAAAVVSYRNCNSLKGLSD
ncbi:MAG TPA: hypothetical protein VM715_07030, partial [Candidatus Acidoferrum sp.]|nr:hypothetical protein [Candidatus Acidoferrum sp.]